MQLDLLKDPFLSGAGMHFRFAIAIVASFSLLIVDTSVAQDTKSKVDRRPTVNRILTVVKPEIEPAEALSPPRDLRKPVVKEYVPKLFSPSKTLTSLKKDIVSRIDVGCLEFTYKPLRMLEVDVPQKSGKMQRKVVTYLIYRIRNRGDHYTHKKFTAEDGTEQYRLEKVDQISGDANTDNFNAHFVLEGWAQNLRTRTYQKKAYLDRFLPEVVKQIEAYDKTIGKLHDSISISKVKIPVEKDDNAKGVWGVAIWEDVDPKINYMSVYVRGLTSAHRVHQLQDDSKKYLHKTLQLNFWRKDDEFDVESEAIVTGIPLSSSLREQSAICRFYHLPGPIVKVSEFDPHTNRESYLFKVVSDYDRKFNSYLQVGLKKGEIPKEIKDNFAKFGVAIPAGVRLTEKIEGQRWEFVTNKGERKIGYRLDFEPNTWRKKGDGVEILKPVDNFWIYR